MTASPSDGSARDRTIATVLESVASLARMPMVTGSGTTATQNQAWLSDTPAAQSSRRSDGQHQPDRHLDHDPDREQVGQAGAEQVGGAIDDLDRALGPQRHEQAQVGARPAGAGLWCSRAHGARNLVPGCGSPGGGDGVCAMTSWTGSPSTSARQVVRSVGVGAALNT